jgi:hypothetical protein
MSPVHRTSLWTAPAGIVACPPLPGGGLRPDALRLPNRRQKKKRRESPRPGLEEFARPQVGEFEVAIRVVYNSDTNRVVLARIRGHSTFSASPASTSAAATNFQPGSGSPSQNAEAPMPNTGTSRAIGATAAAG